MRSILDRVASYIEYHQNNSALNERQIEALASAKSLLVCADTIDQTLSNPIAHHSPSLRQFLDEDEREEENRASEKSRRITAEVDWDFHEESEDEAFISHIISTTIEEFSKAYGIPYENQNLQRLISWSSHIWRSIKDKGLATRLIERTVEFKRATDEEKKFVLESIFSNQAYKSDNDHIIGFFID